MAALWYGSRTVGIATVQAPLQRLKPRGLFHRIDASAQARLVTCGGIPVQRALLDGLVEGGDGLAVGLFGGLLVALFDSLAEGAQRRAQAGRVGAIGGSALFSLTGALERRKMISHVWFVTFVCPARYSVSPELPIIGEQVLTGQTHGMASDSRSAGSSESSA